ncbi:tetratricopeptide repeat protein [Fimbriimonas ginsengisoli]|uniref:TPR repeat-containing protein n=1 Tax=Fimbriimonas ginsengisoli Gsoil 348 TaxID=661478 RepID=A0A068NIZ1_FIMGI|nr:tetratricopeptide repeat protein [Fimbriimonas ginsengisoli]AIE83486.1 TPR repeat-containing protein [Fimbriimonas ginsengisoli Gsoil 348]
MTCPLAALVLLAKTTSLQSEQILTGKGRTLTPVTVVPAQVSARWWHHRLYSPDTPAYGNGFWGVVEASTSDQLRSDLVRMRKLQYTWWEWLGKQGRPEPMPFSAFNTLGPIAVVDDEAWSASWGILGPGAAREVAARKRRLDACRALEDTLFGIFDDGSWSNTFERDLFRNQGLALYQAPWLANAISRLRVIEVYLRAATPLPFNGINGDLANLSDISKHLFEAADQLGKSKPQPGLVTPAISTADALALLNGKFSNYTVNAGEGGAGSTGGTMSFAFTQTGFELSQAPAGWYGGIEPVAFANVDPTTVRYDPLFGGEQRGGIVFQPNDKIRASYRGPSGLLLPLGTTPREAESLAQAFRRLARVANGVAVAEPDKVAEGTTEPDEPTKELVARLRLIADRLQEVGSMRFQPGEISARAPVPLMAAVAQRNGKWRDSEVYNVVAKQLAPGGTFGIGGNRVQPYPFMQRVAVPMNLDPIEAPTWSIVRVNREGGTTNVVTRQACRAKNKKTGRLYIVSRLVQESWSGASTTPRLLGMRLLDAREVEVPAVANAEGLGSNFFAYGDDLMRDNRLPEAEKMFRRAITMRPDWASAWNSLSVAIVRQGRVDDAAPYCLQSVRLNPKFVLGLTNLADIRRVQGKIAESLDLATRATTAAPKDPWAHTVRGHALFANGDFAESEKEYRSAIALEPGNGGNYADLAGALLRQDKKTEATEAASHAIQLGWRSHWVYKELAIPK